ncbi:helix-turn-helix transcriptional regulator [Modestobacter sp. SYSU DS0290]
MAGRTKRDEGARPIHNRINVARAEVGMSRVELARLVGVNPQTIGALERGDHYPSLQLAMSICEVFDLPVEALFSREPFRSITAAYRRTDPRGDQ